jgi:hypothetical protein
MSPWTLSPSPGTPATPSFGALSMLISCGAVR